jgi:hypothetical protein
LVIVFSIGFALSRPHSARAIAPGSTLPPFAVPLGVGALNGDANVATRPHEGAAGDKPACTVRGPEILNICQLYERGPVVLALFVNLGSCSGVVDELQALEPSFPGVRFAAVQVKGSRGELRHLVRSEQLTLPVGYDHDGTLAGLYGMLSCPELVLAYPGGVVAAKPALGKQDPASLRVRVRALVAMARTRGWKPQTP